MKNETQIAGFSAVPENELMDVNGGSLIAAITAFTGIAWSFGAGIIIGRATR